MLAFLNFSHKGEAFATAFGVGGFVSALVLSLIPIPRAARALLVAAGFIAAWVFLFVHSRYGLDRVAWAIILALGLVGWFLGFVPAALVHARQRFANRNAKPLLEDRPPR